MNNYVEALSNCLRKQHFLDFLCFLSYLPEFRAMTEISKKSENLAIDESSNLSWATLNPQIPPNQSYFGL
jgi:hypothetical protein